MRFRVSVLIPKICAFLFGARAIVNAQDSRLKYPQRAFFIKILLQFLHLGSYNNASRAELLKARNVTRFLNVRTSISISLSFLVSRKFDLHLFHHDDPIAY